MVLGGAVSGGLLAAECLLDPMTAFPNSFRIGPYDKNYVYQPATQDHQRICFFLGRISKVAWQDSYVCCLPKASPRPGRSRRGLL